MRQTVPRRLAVRLLAEELAHKLRVAGNCVEGEGEAETEDGADEECRKHQLLLQVHLHPVLAQRGARQEVHHDPNEGYAAWGGGRET